MSQVRLPSLRLDRAILLSLTAICSGSLCGCYDGQAMVDRVAQRLVDDHLIEVELGDYQVTLPRQDGDPVAITVRLDLVATVEREHARAVRRELAEVETHLRHATLMTLRQSRRAELLESDLSSLHARIRSTTEQYLTAPIESIVFHSFAVHED